MDIKFLHQLSNDMHATHNRMLPLWQNIAMEFWPEMADFTQTKNCGDEYADHLMSATPALARRELGDAFESMLRQGDWFSIKTLDPEIDLDGESREFLERATKLQKRVMYDRKAGFQRACKMTDHGYAAMGQWPMTVEPNETRTGLLYRSWHLRDVAFQEDISGQVCMISHKIKIPARDMCRMFGDSCSDEVKRMNSDRPFEKCDIVRMIVPSDMCDYNPRFPFVSVYFDPKKLDCALEVVGQHTVVYVIPRWQLNGSISQYAHSPAAMLAIPDARMFQQMTLAMLDAAEKGASPPMVARNNLFREDWSGAANSIGWADMESDEDIRKSFQVVPSDKSGYQFSLEMLRGTQNSINKSWYNDLLQPPNTSMAKTAYEASIIMQNHIRGLIPVFQPVSAEYQAPLCEMTFGHMLRHGAFGHIDSFPKMLQDTDIEFSFVSPLSQAEDEKKVAQFNQMIQLLSMASGVDQTSRYVFKIDKALRDASQGASIQAKWMNTPQESSDLIAQEQQAQQQAQMMEQIKQASEVAKNLGSGGAGAVGQGLGIPA